MPVEDEVGYSETTPLKIEHLSHILKMHLAVTQAVLNRNDYYYQCYRYVDLTAGKGGTPDGTPGSPVAFMRAAESDEFEKSYRVDLIERNEGNLKDLMNVLHSEVQNRGWPSDKVHFHLGEYENVIPKLFPTKQTLELGLVFVDPTGQVPDVSTLRYLSEMRPRMEILIYVSTTNIKRAHHQTEMLLSDFMEKTGKTNWLIRKPLSWDNFKWTFLLGSSADLFKDYRKIGFLRFDSDEARDFFPKLNLTEKQRQNELQPPLPFISLDE